MSKTKMIKSKKAQEEIVGFVLIIVIVAIIGVIFLSIFLRKNAGEVGDNSQRINSLINSLSQITSKCEIPEAHFQDISDLIRECSKGSICSACEGNTCGKSSCEVLRKTLEESMKASYVVNDVSYVKYYNLTLYSEFDKSPLIEPIILGNTGCQGNKLFNEKSFEDIKMYLEICFNE